MIYIKSEKEIEILREGGHRLADILQKVSKKVAPGVTTEDLDKYARKLIKDLGDEPAFLNYKPAGAPYPYPAGLCVSINDEIVHGIPNIKRVLKEGDIVSIDLGLKHKNMFTDHAMTLSVGRTTDQSKKLIDITEKALYVGIGQARAGNHVGDIGSAIENFVKKYRYGIVRELSGHGVGKEIHEDPYVPNYGKAGKGAILKSGMVIAIEPMLNLGTASVIFMPDGYTVKTKDGKKSAHFEHTVLITDGDPEILTK